MDRDRSSPFFKKRGTSPAARSNSRPQLYTLRHSLATGDHTDALTIDGARNEVTAETNALTVEN